MDSSDVVVEEVDRRAAARLVGLPSTADDEIVDRDPAVQAFARHRIAAEQAQAARIASLEAQLENMTSQSLHQYDECNRLRNQISQARVEGVRMGIEAATGCFQGSEWAMVTKARISILDPVTIAKEYKGCTLPA